VTRHSVAAKVERSGSDVNNVDWTKISEILVCGGCDHTILRKSAQFSEFQYRPGDLNPDPEYYPTPVARSEPQWAQSLDDNTLRHVLRELYVAYNSNLRYLAAVGARTVLDLVLIKHVADVGRFDQKLDKFVGGGFVSAAEREHLDVLAEVGNAAAHRGYAPTQEELGTILDILESLLHRLYIEVRQAEQIALAAQGIKAKIPPRKGREA
jgi:hypothetical protein